MEAVQLMLACSQAAGFLRFLSKYSFTNIQEDGQLSWLLACGEWLQPLHDLNMGHF